MSSNGHFRCVSPQKTLSSFWSCTVLWTLGQQSEFRCMDLLLRCCTPPFGEVTRLYGSRVFWQTRKQGTSFGSALLKPLKIWEGYWLEVRSRGDFSSGISGWLQGRRLWKITLLVENKAQVKKLCYLQSLKSHCIKDYRKTPQDFTLTSERDGPD